MTCKHITTASHRAALRDGGRYWDEASHSWRCPWCEDWDRAVEARAALEQEDEAASSLLALHAAALAPADRPANGVWGDGVYWDEASRSWRSTAARDALVASLAAAPWGRQPDGSFVTTSSFGIASGRYCYTLHAPGKGGPLAVVRDHAPDGWSHPSQFRLDQIRTRAEARAIREAERAAARNAQLVYEASLSRAAELLRTGTELPWFEGQEGGYLLLGQASVSARGTLRRLGLDWDDVEIHSVRRDWYHRDDYMRVRSVDVETRPRRLPARARRLPARDRALQAV